MSTSLQAKFVQCPFYENDERGCIRCEGVVDDTRLKLSFQNRDGSLDQDRKLDYLHTYCIHNYQSCRIHKMLMGKYE